MHCLKQQQESPAAAGSNPCRSLAPMLPSSFVVFVVAAFLRLEPRFILTTPHTFLGWGVHSVNIIGVRPADPVAPM